MGKPSAPAAPDPTTTAAAQTSSNIATANNNAQLNRVNQYTPYGSSTYDVTGTSPDGTPQYSQTTTLSPQEQQLFNTSMQGQQALGDTALAGIQNVKNTYANNFNPGDYGASVQQAQDAAYKAQTQYLDPQFAQGQQSLNSQLANQGLSTGSTAYDNAQTNFGNQKQQAYQSAQNAAVSAGNQEQQVLFGQGLTQYNQPLNTYNALMTGAQVQNPTFSSVPGATQANTDVAGITNSGYQNQLAAFQQNQSGINNLFSLGGSLGSAAILASDRRLKRDIQRVGKIENGLPWYRFSYIWDAPGTIREGLMSDDVRKFRPKAVIVGNDGFDRVFYPLAMAT